MSTTAGRWILQNFLCSWWKQKVSRALGMSSRATTWTTRERLLRMSSQPGCADMEGCHLDIYRNNHSWFQNNRVRRNRAHDSSIWWRRRWRNRLQWVSGNPLNFTKILIFKTVADGLPPDSSRKSNRSRYQPGETSKARSQKLLRLSILYLILLVITCKSILLFILITWLPI